MSPEGVDPGLTAIETFVRHVQEHEPGSRMYSAFEAVYRPYLTDGPVRFTNYVEVASNRA